jgi:hypothetical protein
MNYQIQMMFFLIHVLFIIRNTDAYKKLKCTRRYTFVVRNLYVTCGFVATHDFYHEFHYKKHSHQFNCDSCDKGFHTEFKLEEHGNSHTGKTASLVFISTLTTYFLKA